jgi:hypothetical protein
MTIGKTTLLALLLAGGAAVAGEASPPAASTEATAKPVSAEAEGTDASRPAKARTCASVSGTRIRPNPAHGCRSAIGPMRVYTQEDLLRTGEIDINEALRKLDPIFR